MSIDLDHLHLHDAIDAVTEFWDAVHKDAWDEHKQYQVCKLCKATILGSNDVEKEHAEFCPLIKAYAALDALGEAVDALDANADEHAG